MVLLVVVLSSGLLSVETLVPPGPIHRKLEQVELVLSWMESPSQMEVEAAMVGAAGFAFTTILKVSEAVPHPACVALRI